MRRIKYFQRKSPVESVIYCLVSLLFAIVAISYLYILLWTLMSALKTHTEIVMDPFALPAKLNWDHFIEVTKLLEVNGQGFWRMLFNSSYFSVLGAFLTQFITAFFAYVCTKYKFPGCEIPYLIILVTMTLPIYGAGGATYKLYRDLGLVDSYAHIICNLGGMNVNFLYYRAFFKNVSNTYAEAAQMDGAGHFTTYFRVIFPQAKPIFGALFLTTWLGSWNTYESALIYLPNLPTLPVGLFQFNTEMIYRARLDILFAGCFITAIPALVLFVGFNKVITTNVSLGGIKG